MPVNRNCLTPGGSPQNSQGPSLSQLDGNELKSQEFGLFLEFALDAPLVEEFLCGEDGFIVGLPGGEQMEDDAGQLVGCGGNGFGRSQLGTHAAKIVAQPGLASVQAVGGHAQRPGG